MDAFDIASRKHKLTIRCFTISPINTRLRSDRRADGVRVTSQSTIYIRLYTSSHIHIVRHIDTGEPRFDFTLEPKNEA